MENFDSYSSWNYGGLNDYKLFVCIPNTGIIDSRYVGVEI